MAVPVKVPGTQLVDVDWGAREAVCTKLIRKKDQRGMFIAYLDMLSSRGRTETFLQKHGISWPNLNAIMHRDKSRTLFSLFRQAQAMGADYRQQIREDEADRRAIEGVEKPIVYKGRKTGDTVTEYSDHLLALQLRAGNPEKYSDRKEVHHSGTVLHMEIQGVEREPKVIDVKDSKSKPVDKDPK